MAIWLKQSTAVVVSFGPFLLNSDGVTLVTNLVGTGANQTENTSTGIRISKNGGAFAARHATATASSYDAFGNYLVTLDTTDTGTLGALRMQFANGAAFCPVWMDFMVVPAMIYDSIIGGTDRLDANVTHMNDVAASAITTIKAVQGLATDGVVPTVTTLTNAPADPSGVTTLLSRLSSARAGYLDNLSAGAAALEASIQALITTVGSAGAGLTAADDAVIAAIAALNNLSQANIRTAIGLASANLDTQLDALPTNAELATALGTADDAVLAAIAALNNLAAGAAMTLTSGERDAIAAALLDLANGIEPGITLRQAQRVQLDAVSAKLSGAATAEVKVRNQADTLDRITATVDADGNRTAVTLNLG